MTTKPDEIYNALRGIAGDIGQYINRFDEIELGREMEEIAERCEELADQVKALTDHGKAEQTPRKVAYEYHPQGHNPAFLKIGYTLPNGELHVQHQVIGLEATALMSALNNVPALAATLLNNGKAEGVKADPNAWHCMKCDQDIRLSHPDFNTCPNCRAVGYLTGRKASQTPQTVDLEAVKADIIPYLSRCVPQGDYTRIEISGILDDYTDHLATTHRLIDLEKVKRMRLVPSDINYRRDLGYNAALDAVIALVKGEK